MYVGNVFREDILVSYLMRNRFPLKTNEVKVSDRYTVTSFLSNGEHQNVLGDARCAPRNLAELAFAMNCHYFAI